MAETSEESGLRFQLGRIPVLVRPVFFLIPVIGAYRQGWAQVLIWAAVVFGSVLLHELGHAWAMQAFGFNPNIVLHGMGGFTRWNGEQQRRPSAGVDLLVSLAGPGIQLTFAVLVYVSSRFIDLSPAVAGVVSQVVWVNVLWPVVNLLPILPWDGGQSLDAFIRLVSDTPLRPKIVGGTSMLGGGLALAYAVYSFNALFGYFGVMGLMNGWRVWKPPPPVEAETPTNVDQALAATDDETIRAAVEERLKSKDLEVVHDISTRLFQAGRFALVETLLRMTLGQHPDPKAAYNLACTLCHLNRLDEAQAMLEEAVRLGYDEQHTLLTDEDLAPLRGRADFQALAAPRAVPSQ